MSWSVTMRERDPARLEHAFEELLEICRASLAARFPPAAGYDTRQVRICGPVEGLRFEVTRGRFRGYVSAQRYTRVHRSSASHRGDPVGIRLVAHTQMAPRPGGIQAPSTMSGWGVAGCALGTVSLGTLGLGVAGLISTWMQALLLIPALVAWRTCTAISLARTMTPAPALRGQVRPGDPLAADAVARWNRAMVPLAAHRDVLDQTQGQAPFREPARALSAVG